jgi:hypothetical protein
VKEREGGREGGREGEGNFSPGVGGEKVRERGMRVGVPCEKSEVSLPSCAASTLPFPVQRRAGPDGGGRLLRAARKHRAAGEAALRVFVFHTWGGG